MSRLATSFVLGYHGCDAKVAQRLIAGKASIKPSNRDFDWLGPGAYFWESDPHRALEFAEWKVQRGEYESAAVVGAAIDLGNCLDLANRENLTLLKGAHAALVEYIEAADLEMPENKDARDDPNEDHLLRYLDCAVIQRLHGMMQAGFAAGSGKPPFDTVRGMFTEGAPVYVGCGFRERTHVQIAVKNPDHIIGLFKPLRL